MQRKNLTIGQRVFIVPEWTNKDLPAPAHKSVVVRELHNPKTAGVSYRKTGKSIYGVLYTVLQPFPTNRKSKAL